MHKPIKPCPVVWFGLSLLSNVVATFTKQAHGYYIAALCLLQDLRTGYNGKAGDLDVDFEWVHNKRPPVNSGKCVNYHRKKADKDLMQAMIDRLEEQKKVAKATDLGMIPRYAFPLC